MKISSSFFGAVSIPKSNPSSPKKSSSETSSEPWLFISAGFFPGSKPLFPAATETSENPSSIKSSREISSSPSESNETSSKLSKETTSVSAGCSVAKLSTETSLSFVSKLSVKSAKSLASNDCSEISVGISISGVSIFCVSKSSIFFSDVNWESSLNISEKSVSSKVSISGKSGKSSESKESVKLFSSFAECFTQTP